MTVDASSKVERPAWLASGPLARLLGVLDGNGEEARVVGGAVRHTLFGLPPGDVDIATTALPDEIVRRASAAGFHVVPTGLEHGTVTVVADGRPFEVTTLRRDIETDGRHAVVRFGRDWHADAARRDFTINALFFDRDGRVIDLVDGLSDIKARRVRFIGDPDARIREDFLRVLRFFRFFAAYGEGPPDPAALAACIRAREELAQLSRERVRVELLKLLVAKRAAETLGLMTDAGILDRVLGGVPDLAAFARLAEIERVLALAADPVRRLGALAVRIAEDVTRLRERLRLSNEEVRTLESMTGHWWRVGPGPHWDRRESLYRVGPNAYRNQVLLAFARSPDSVADAGWRDLAGLPERWQAPRFPLAAKDFLERGMKPGPELGVALAEAEAAWIRSDFPSDAKGLADIVHAAIKLARDGAGKRRRK